MDGSKRRAEFTPLAIGEADVHRVVTAKKGKDDDRVGFQGAPERLGVGSEWSKDMRDAVLDQQTWDQQAGGIDDSLPDFDEIGDPLPCNGFKDEGIRIVAKRQKANGSH